MFLTDKNSRLILLGKYMYRLSRIYCSYILRFWSCRSVKNFSYSNQNIKNYTYKAKQIV
jgi:hypothetical protein